jgi:hypothetical protein
MFLGLTEMDNGFFAPGIILLDAWIDALCDGKQEKVRQLNDAIVGISEEENQ